jgi:hypothetical protein
MEGRESKAGRIQGEIFVGCRVLAAEYPFSLELM